MELLLPYANDINGNLIHISDSQKGHKYTCPNCGKELLLRKGRVRIAHFAHKIKTDDENRCSESVLHKQFKKQCSEVISAKIKEKQELFFAWKCIRCRQTQTDNLLSDVVEVATEYNLGVCRPDIALLDSEGKVIKIVEIVVSHSPEEKSLKYYKENDIVCLKVKVADFKECDEIEKVLIDSERVEIYPERECEECKTAVRQMGRGVYGFNSIGLSQIARERSLKERLEGLLKEREDEVLCKECGGKMEVVIENEFRSHRLRCKRYPTCNYNRSVDTLEWPHIFKW